MYYIGKLILFLLGAMWVIMGIMALVMPKKLRNFMGVLSEKFNPRKLFWIPLVAGIIIYLTSVISSLGWLIKIMGVLGILKGLFFIFAPADLLKKVFKWWGQMPEGLLRVIGLPIGALGILVIYSLFA